MCELVLIASDDLIAGLLNRNALKTGNGNRWTRERVTSMRSNYRIPVFKPAADGVEPWLNLTDAAKLLKVSTRTLRLAAEAGEIRATHPLPDGPGSSHALLLPQMPPNPSPHGRGRTQNTPRDPALGPQHRRDPAIAIATIPGSQTDDVGGERLFIRPTSGLLALGRTVLAENRAGKTLRDRELRHDMIDAATATGGA
ncbi:hypothetical protein CHELA20_40298 [Hyphomicrobiales bacterium]|nr:hypothetical protein CHELA20_40298 [Hyphomicrobiales bacterium]CAH1688085.1 hypothetical protein CHELA41_40155 [Hyphomicrobiales bacterium]